MVREHFRHAVTGNGRNVDRRYRADGVIHSSQEKAIGTAKVARNHKGQDLPTSIRKDAVTRGHSLLEQEHRSRDISFRDELGVRGMVFIRRSKLFNESDIRG